MEVLKNFFIYSLFFNIINLLAMKTKTKENTQASKIKVTSMRSFTHYFHADEDFREDHNWGKTTYTGAGGKNEEGNKAGASL